MTELEKRVRKAVRHFWRTREQQANRQGSRSGVRDAGARSAVTGGKQLNGFVDLCAKLLGDSGLPDSAIFRQTRLELPGYFRAEKNWDLLAILDGELIAVIEFKSQVGPSFGNNFNNRVEEALGNANDLWAAYREGALKGSARPWLGYVFILEECERSLSPVRVKEPHFPVFPEFQGASYAKRYEIFLTKLLRERLYDGASLILTPQQHGLKGEYQTPSEELGFENFAKSLKAHSSAYAS